MVLPEELPEELWDALTCITILRCITTDEKILVYYIDDECLAEDEDYGSSVIDYRIASGRYIVRDISQYSIEFANVIGGQTEEEEEEEVN